MNGKKGPLFLGGGRSDAPESPSSPAAPLIFGPLQRKKGKKLFFASLLSFSFWQKEALGTAEESALVSPPLPPWKRGGGGGGKVVAGVVVL